MKEFRHSVQVYYEDTDFSGVVYHANYLKYFERAREHLLGTDRLVRLYNEDGVGFVVYKAELVFKEGARFGDALDIVTTVTVESAYRTLFDQRAMKEGRLLVQGKVQLACVDREHRLVKTPEFVVNEIAAANAS